MSERPWYALYMVRPDGSLTYVTSGFTPLPGTDPRQATVLRAERARILRSDDRMCLYETPLRLYGDEMSTHLLVRYDDFKVGPSGCAPGKGPGPYLWPDHDKLRPLIESWLKNDAA